MIHQLSDQDVARSTAMAGRPAARQRRVRWSPFAVMAALSLATSAPTAQADSRQESDEDAFEVAELFFELNDTDGDLGIHALIDGDAWKTLKIANPDDKQILMLRVTRNLAKQGLTEIFIESEEPTFDELDPQDFFARFPEGAYEISARTIEGGELASAAQLTHRIPAPPDVQLNGQPVLVDCDADDLPTVSEPVTISWDAVTLSHPDPALSPLGQEPITVVNYEVVVEIDETPFSSSTVLPSSATSFEVPSEILALGDEIKFEVLVREESFNQTAIESCFLR